MSPKDSNTYNEVENKPKYSFVKIGLKLPSYILKNKIEKRIKEQLRDGMISEIKKLDKNKMFEVKPKKKKNFGL